MTGVGDCDGSSISAVTLRGDEGWDSLVMATAGDWVLWRMERGIDTLSVVSGGGEGSDSLSMAIAGNWVHCVTGSGVGSG